jgi:iron(III) transport system ATP-binding protein
MNGGRIEQIGTPREVYERPATPFVADFVGSTNFVPATVHGADGEAGFYRVRCEFGDLRAHGDGLAAGDKVMLSVRPEDVHLSEARPEGANVWEGTVDQKVFLGETVDFQIVINGRKLQSRAHPSLRTRVGESIFIRIDPEKCVALRGETK